MKMIPAIIKCIVAIIILFLPAAYSQTEVNKRLDTDTTQTTSPLARQSAAEESRMIREDKLSNYVTVKVTTTNQKKFDANHDGYLSGREFQRYLKHYTR